MTGLSLQFPLSPGHTDFWLPFLVLFFLLCSHILTSVSFGHPYFALHFLSSAMVPAPSGDLIALFLLARLSAPHPSACRGVEGVARFSRILRSSTDCLLLAGPTCTLLESPRGEDTCTQWNHSSSNSVNLRRGLLLSQGAREFLFRR